MPPSAMIGGTEFPCYRDLFSLIPPTIFPVICSQQNRLKTQETPIFPVLCVLPRASFPRIAEIFPVIWAELQERPVRRRLHAPPISVRSRRWKIGGNPLLPATLFRRWGMNGPTVAAG